MIKSKNKGYSLVELIIVLAIVGVVATMSLISINVLFSAKVKNDATTVNSEISALKAKRSYAPAVDGSGTSYKTVYPALRLYRHGLYGRYYLQECIYDTNSKSFIYYGGSVSTFTYTNEDGDDVTVSVDAQKIDSANNGMGTQLSSYTTVNYLTPGSADTDEGVDVATINIGSANGLFIMFDRDGTLHAYKDGSDVKFYGEGQLKFKKRNGNEVAKVYIRGNGSHEVK
jgi:prepilin-type N-terminal cleavage/methylation domain-containing protein